MYSFPSKIKELAGLKELEDLGKFNEVKELKEQLFTHAPDLLEK